MQRHTISFRNAAIGIWTAVTTQANIRIHVLVGSLVLFAGVYLQLSLDHMLILLIVTVLVIAAEMINTALEFAANAITTRPNEHIKNAKDVSAGAVLTVSIFAVIIGIIIFAPVLISNLPL
jgi:undecaprenol kinase